MKVNKTIPPRQVEISLLTRCIATRRQEKIFEENSEADEDEARLHNFSSSAEKLLVRIYLFLSLSLFFFNLRENLVRGVYKRSMETITVNYLIF